ncbi:MAG: hypothetical protein ABFS56_24035 [Pseudomonadota bacterium]
MKPKGGSEPNTPSFFTPSQCKELEDSTKATLEDNYKVKRHRLERELATDLDQLSDDDKTDMLGLWNQGKIQKGINALGEAVLRPMHAIAVAKHLLQTQAQDSEAHGFWTRWLIRTGILASLGIRFNEGVFECNQKFWFTYKDLQGAWWYKWACEHKDAVNGSGLGARIKGDAPSDKEMGMWIRAMGIRLSSKLVDLKWCQKNDGFVTDLAYNLLKNKSQGLSQNNRPQIRVYQVNAKAMEPLFDVLFRRSEAGTMPWRSTADGFLDKEEQALACAGIQPQYHHLQKSVESERFTARRFVQNGILDSLHIKPNDDGIYECDPEFMFTYKDLAGTSWYQWACEHKETVNNADLGAKISGEAPSDKEIGVWIRALGVRLSVKKIDAYKYLDFKGKIQPPAKTVTAPGSHQAPGATSKTAGVAKKAFKNQERITAYKVNPKSMKKLGDTMGIKEPILLCL